MESGVRQRILTALVLALFVLADLAGFAHLALTSHHVCPEHGRVEHGTLALAAEHAPAPDGPSVQSAAQDDHDLCAPAAARAEQPFALQPLPIEPALAPSAALRFGLPVQSPRERGGVPLLLLAPKQSPPLT